MFKDNESLIKHINELEMQCVNDNEEIKNLNEQLLIATTALKDISKTCPLLAGNKHDMYTDKAADLFLRSTVRRLETASKAIKDIEDYGKKL
ncbi:MAG: hypothetical protein PHY47_01050 [Lachnospiraceae bacterium]|nr:hypothetical protein [Lachnospiraceae bacterium]